MKVKPFRIPRSIALPGLLVTVREVARDDVPLEGADGDWNYDDPAGVAVITINKDLPITRKRYIVLHELQHVMIDYLHDVLDNHQDKAKP